MRFILIALLSISSFSQELTHSVYFETDKSIINSTETQNIDTFLKSLDTIGIKKIIVHGYCDDRGTQSYNLSLSHKRARAIELYLKDNEIPERLIKIISGKGEVGLIASSNESNVNNLRQGNRRVDIIVKANIPNITESEATEMPTAQELLKKELKIGDKIRLKNLYFKTGYATILPNSIETLTEIADILVQREDIYFTIEGHVCCTHDTYDAVDRKTNKRNLSVSRAKFIYNYLLRKGVKKNRMKFIGMKRKDPLGGNPKYDRRVEILITHVANR
jgi:outer membrane protein OmpA-like peptidoglycan-associated protein